LKCFFFQAEDGIRDFHVTGVQTCALPILTEADSILVRTMEKAAVPLTGQPGDFDAIIEAARGKSLVMIGEATHGTREFYHTRARSEERRAGKEGRRRGAGAAGGQTEQ